MTTTLSRRLLYATVAFVAGLLGARALIPEAPTAWTPALERATRWPDSPPLPRLDLVDESGAVFDGTAFRGRWTYVFFGFTSCPDICPSTLTVLAQVRRELHDLPEALQPTILLVTVDPTRDDAARLAAFVRHFDPRFRAVTGEPREIQRLAAALHAAYARVDLADGGYTMDHASSLFLIGPDGNLVATSGAPHDVAAIARDYRALAVAPAITTSWRLQGRSGLQSVEARSDDRPWRRQPAADWLSAAPSIFATTTGGQR
jgi:protein SCO1/2